MGQLGLVDDIRRRTIGIQPNGSIRNAANFHIRPGAARRSAKQVPTPRFGDQDEAADNDRSDPQ